MYKRAARLAGMEVLKEGEGIAGEFETLEENWDASTSSSSKSRPPTPREKTATQAQVRGREESRRALPNLLNLGPDARP